MLMPSNSTIPGMTTPINWGNVLLQTGQGIAQKLANRNTPRTPPPAAVAPVTAPTSGVNTTTLVIGAVVLYLLLQKGGRL